jgi:hypothetical protein
VKLRVPLPLTLALAALLSGRVAVASPFNFPRQGAVSAAHNAPQECTGTHNPVPGTRENAPQTHTDKAYVERVLATSRVQLRKQFHGLRRLRVKRRYAEVWTQDASGTPLLTGTVVDYWIVVQLRLVNDCPSGPWFWQGVPLHFIVSP